ncbi:MAG: hypothetical protein FJY82_06265, partial [Candidatus Aminicenantes bacterium]|nr:hypothetical protein [Candidatus Aminicenantes bacterium]
MLGRSTNRLLPPSLLLAAAVLFPSPAPGQTTWKLKEIKYTNEQKKMGPNEAVGRGPDFVKWTPTASPFPPPSTLRLGDTVSLSLDASYQYGAGDDGSQTGRPKQGWIEVSVLGQTDSKRVDLVQNTCRWKVPPDLPPNMPKSGSLKASKSVAITEAFKDAKALTISGHVSFNIYCWEGEAHGSSGFRATYEKVPGGPIAGAPSGDNEAPTVSLTANHADLKYFEGEKVILDADARDDKDRPDQMSYTWEVVNLDTGGSRRKGPTQNWRRLTQEISVKTPPRDKTIRFRFKVTVTDRQGAQGEASVEIELLKPDITQLEFQNSSKNFVAEYLSNGLKVCRRGQYFAVDVHLENISAKHHTLRLFIDGQRVQAGEANESDWVILKRGWKDPRKVYRLVVFVPPAVPVGEHKVDVSIIRKSDEAELDKEPLAPDPFVLFNPFSRTLLPDASVRKPNPIPESLAHSYTLGAQDYYFYPGSTGIVPRPVTVTPFDPSVFKAAKEFVMGMPKPARADAVSVADFFVRKVYGEMLSGNWSGNYAGGLAPWLLASKGAPFIARQYLDHGKVKFAQCFVYGQMVTALLRSVGIPTRTLTNEGSGHDSRAPWGALLNYFDRSGKPTKVYEVWNFHVWNEAWIPALSPAGGWVLLDATGQSRASDSRADSIVAVPSRDSVPAVAELPEGRQYSDGQDDV